MPSDIEIDWKARAEAAERALSDETQRREGLERSSTNTTGRLIAAGIMSFGWNHEGVDKLAAERDDWMKYAEQLTKLATTFVDAFYREFHSGQAKAERWQGWENGLDLREPEDAACHALMKFLTENGAALSKNTVETQPCFMCLGKGATVRGHPTAPIVETCPHCKGARVLPKGYKPSDFRPEWNGVVNECPDGLLPDGEVCPRCGGRRGPSGVDGGSWVHYPRAVPSQVNSGGE